MSPAIRLLCLIFSFALGASSRAELSRERLDAEATNELRLERILVAKGHRALFQHLEAEMARNPQPYTKAWYANYLIYGDLFQLPDVMDQKRGFALAKESMTEGSLFGTELVGRAYGDGRGPGFRDTMASTRYLKKAAEQGRDSAMCELAKFYFLGRPGIPANRDEGERWARQGGWLGATAGLSYLAEWWEDPKYTNPPDPERALALHFEVAQLGCAPSRQLIHARATAGDERALKYEKLMYLVDAREGAVAYPSHIKAAVKWLLEHAGEEPRVQIAIAELLMEKRGPVYDGKLARELLTKAAATGNDDARELLAMMAWRGIGQKADPMAAIATWRELAEKGNARALNSYGWIHWWEKAEKHGIPKDARKAYELCRRSADLGHWRALFNVAHCYAHGVGTELNYHLAVKYYDLLEKRGYISAREMKDRVLGHLNKE